MSNIIRRDFKHGTTKVVGTIGNVSSSPGMLAGLLNLGWMSSG